MKKNVKKNDTSDNDIVAEIDKRFERHANILMEHMTKEIKIVAEGHGILVRKIDKIESDVVELKTDVHLLKTDVHLLKTDVHVLKTDMKEVKKDMREVKSELHYMNMALMDTSHETKDHEKRIKKIEEKVFV